MHLNIDLTNINKLKPHQIQALKQMLNLLASRDEDYASVRNYWGFNKADTELGHALAHQANGDGLSEANAVEAKGLLFKYHNQLPADLFRIVYGRTYDEIEKLRKKKVHEVR